LLLDKGIERKKGSAFTVPVWPSAGRMTRYFSYHRDKLSRLAQPSDLIKSNFFCGIRSLAERGRVAPILRGRFALI
jgi:hypothetical protein